MFRRGPRTAPRQNQNQRRRPNVRSLVTRNTRMLNASRPSRIPVTRQLLSIPAHSYSFKIQKVFRELFLLSNTTVSVSLTIDDIKGIIRNELGITAGTAGENIALHEVRVYALVRSFGTTSGSEFTSADLDVRVHDIEETVAGNSNLVDRYLDSSSSAGVAHIAYRYPVNNRPTMNRSTTNITVLTVTTSTPIPANASVQVAVDILADYTRVTLDNLLDRRIAALSLTT